MLMSDDFAQEFGSLKKVHSAPISHSKEKVLPSTFLIDHVVSVLISSDCSSALVIGEGDLQV